MISELLQALSYPFVLRALIVGSLVSLCAALLGVILVLKRYSLIGHGLADVGFASLSIGLAMGLSVFTFSMPVVIAASFAIMFVSQRYKAKGDVAIGIASTGALALGVIVVARTKGFNVDVCNYMFGSILAMSNGDLYLSLGLSAAVILLYALFYNRLFLMTHDEDFARACGINVSFYQFLLSFLIAITVVIGMRMIGTLLISSLIIFPAVTARRLTATFKGMTIAAAVISVGCFVAGKLASIVMDWPTGASVVAVNIAAFSTSIILNLAIRRKAQYA